MSMISMQAHLRRITTKLDRQVIREANAMAAQWNILSEDECRKWFVYCSQQMAKQGRLPKELIELTIDPFGLSPDEMKKLIKKIHHFYEERQPFEQQLDNHRAVVKAWKEWVIIKCKR